MLSSDSCYQASPRKPCVQGDYKTWTLNWNVDWAITLPKADKPVLSTTEVLAGFETVHKKMLGD